MNSLLPAVLSNMSEKKTVIGDIARYCLSFNGTPTKQIGLAFFQCQIDREKARQQMQDLGTSTTEPAFKPERFLSFVQSVMNSVCWAARKYDVALERPDFGTGLDYANDLAETLGIEPVDKKGLVGIVDADFVHLDVLHSAMMGRMTYLTNVDPLFHFEQRTRDEETGNWFVEKQCTTYDDAKVEMDAIVARLQEEQIAKEQSDFLALIDAA
jgi:hypothetical protein